MEIKEYRLKKLMNYAEKLAEKSKCKKLQVGAVIIDALTLDVIGQDFNRLPGKAYFNDSCHISGHGCHSDNGCKWTLHAEQAALLNLKRPVHRIILVCTHYPCLDCLKLLLEKGLCRVYYRWNHKTSEVSQKLLKMRGIPVSKITTVL